MIYIVITTTDAGRSWQMYGQPHDDSVPALKALHEAQALYPGDTFEMHCVNERLYIAMRWKIAA